MKIGMIGLDSSHAVEFTRILHDASYDYYLGGAKIAAATPFYSTDLPLSYTRVQGFTDKIRAYEGIQLKDNVQRVAEKCDAILLTSVDGRNRVDVFQQLAPLKKPVFIDKPLALSVGEADEIFDLSEKFGTPIMSTSSLRYDAALTTALQNVKEDVNGLYVHGPLPLQEKMPGYFWYGIHMVEVLVTVLGTECKQVYVDKSSEYDIAVVQMMDGRFCTIKGDREWHQRFGAMIHTSNNTIPVEIGKGSKPYYVSLLENILQFFSSGISPIHKEEMLAVIRILEAINKSREYGYMVEL
ncbi:Gfo/Idh/MocA family protein [Fredinandcohnia humi]